MKTGKMNKTAEVVKVINLHMNRTKIYLLCLV